MHKSNTDSTPGITGKYSTQTWLLAALVPFIVLALWQMRVPLDLSLGDQAQYVLHARSMLEGRGYTDNGYIYYPKVGLSPAAYPPGLPLLIAGTQFVTGSLMGARLLLIAAAVLFLYIAGRYLATLDDERLAPATILVCGFTPLLALFASGLYTDFIFSVMVWACFLIVDRQAPWTPRRVAALALLGALAILFRTVGIALIPALIMHQTWRAWRHKERVTPLLIPLVTWIAAYFVLEHFYPTTSGYSRQITSMANPLGTEPTYIVMLRSLFLRIMEYRNFVSGLQFIPFPWKLANVIYHVIALGAAFVGAVAWVRRAGIRFLFCFVVFYVAAMLVMPWAISRFLWPLLPLLWFATLDGVRILAKLVSNERRALHTSLATALVVPIVAIAIGPPVPRDVGVGDLPQGRELYAVIQPETARAPVRAVFFNPRDMARLRNVSAMSIPDIRQTDSFLLELRAYRISHAVLGSLKTQPYADRAIRNAVAAHPEAFNKMFANDSFTVYRVLPLRPAPVDSQTTQTPQTTPAPPR